MLVNVDQIVISNKFKHSHNDFKYFIGYKNGEIVKPLCIILPQINGYMKYFESGGKNMYFMIKNDDVLDKYNETWNNIKNTLNIKFHSMPVYDEKYIKAKVREFNVVITYVLTTHKWVLLGWLLLGWLLLIWLLLRWLLLRWLLLRWLFLLLSLCSFP